MICVARCTLAVIERPERVARSARRRPPMLAIVIQCGARRVPGLRLTGWGIALPDRVVTNDELSQTLDTSDEWITERTGIRERRVGGSARLARALAAARTAHRPRRRRRRRARRDPARHHDAGPADPRDGTGDPGRPRRPVPGDGPERGVQRLHVRPVGRRAGCSRRAADGCCSSARSTSRAGSTGTTAPWRSSSATARARSVLEATDDDGDLLGFDVGADGSLVHLISCEHGGYIQMDGKETFRRAVRDHGRLRPASA